MVCVNSSRAAGGSPGAGAGTRCVGPAAICAWEVLKPLLLVGWSLLTSHAVSLLLGQHHFSCLNVADSVPQEVCCTPMHTSNVHLVFP
jgi:hypothetical protein